GVCQCEPESGRANGSVWIAAAAGTTEKHQPGPFVLPLRDAAVRSRKISIEEPLRMNDREPKRAHLAGDAAARREQILEHQAERNLVLGEFFRADGAHAVFL